MKHVVLWIVALIIVVTPLFVLQQLPVHPIKDGAHSPGSGYLQLKGWPWISETDSLRLMLKVLWFGGQLTSPLKQTTQ